MSSAPRREVAVRINGRELNRSTETFKESDEDRAPNYLLLASGEKANRAFVSGTITEVEERNNGNLQARIVEPSSNNDEENRSTIFVKAGPYDPVAKRQLEKIETPQFVTVVGKPGTFTPEDGDRTYVSIDSPEHVAVVERSDRDRWVLETAQQTIDRIKAFENGDAEYGEMAQEQYNDLDETLSNIFESAVDMIVDLADEDAAEEVLEQYDGDFEVSLPSESSTGTDDSDEDVDADEGDDVDADSDSEDNSEGEDSVEESPEDVGADLAE